MLRMSYCCIADLSYTFNKALQKLEIALQVWMDIVCK